MKFLFVIAAAFALAVAKPAKRDFIMPGPAGPAPIIDLDQGIAIGPAIIAPPDNIIVGPAIVPNPDNIAIGPAIIPSPDNIAIGPALVDFPLPDGALAEVNPVMPAPVGPSNAPLVQIILNIRSPSDVAVDTVQSPPVSPVQVVEQPIVPEPVIIVDQPIIPEPVIVVDKPIVPEPVIVVDKPTIPEPVIVVDKPEAPESVIIAQPIISVPAVNIPETIN